MSTLSWKQSDPEIVKILKDLDINGFESAGGTDKDTIHNYTGIYAEVLKPYRKKTGRLLEIGVQHGGSSLLWHEYLPNFFLDLIDQVDIAPDKIWYSMNPERFEFYQGDAYSQTALDIFNVNKYDVIIDDGPHSLASQQYAVNCYYPLLSSGGTLIIEDIQNIDHIDVLTDCLEESLRDRVQIFDVRETRGRYDDLIWSIVKP